MHLKESRPCRGGTSESLSWWPFRAESCRWLTYKAAGDLCLQSASQGGNLSIGCSAGLVASVSDAGSATFCRKEGELSELIPESGKTVGYR